MLLAAGCTGGDDPHVPRVLDTVDLDAAVGTDVVVHDLAGSLVLVGDAGRRWLVPLDGGAPTPIDPDSELVIGDGTPLVVGTALTPVGGAALPLPIDGPPTAALLDGEALVLARDTRLAAVDPGTGAVRATAEAPAPVTEIARAPDGDLAALADDPADGVLLLRLTPDLRPEGDPLTVVPERTSTPTALQVTEDGTVVVTAYVNEARDAGRLVTVAGGRVRTVAELQGTDATALDVAVVGRIAYLVLSASYHPAELTAVDLTTGARTAVVGLCGGAGAFGALAADGTTVTVVGSCIDADGPTTTAFVIG
ncbi:hypothetical protein SAMN04488107_2546 [Geodermatophilus saharensis]|uniref:Uncharacterized protein n=1 Tax=Geodermatophilus saharensis TaxID=1137994 RepID=A0A239EFY7_9ACTN|nr:hypothetical protein [Geodermatophilus saharensis]SNS43575.1 hypothetical protein SAMN04488107_2546 [Geodermatophilus saharensis]